MQSGQTQDFLMRPVLTAHSHERLLHLLLHLWMVELPLTGWQWSPYWCVRELRGSGVFFHHPIPTVDHGNAFQTWAAAQFVHCGGTGSVSSSCPAEPFSPASQPSHRPLSRLTAAGGGAAAEDPALSLQGMNVQVAARWGRRLRLPQTSPSQQPAEVVSHLWDRAIPSTSSCVLCLPARGWALLCPVSPF